MPRSYYLDDLSPPSGSVVVCKANLSAPHFTVGKEYGVQPDKSLIDDIGIKCFPSARFQLVGD